MKEIIKKYLNNNDNPSTEEETNMEQKIIREGFDFMARKAAWKDSIDKSFAEIDSEILTQTPPVPLARYWTISFTILLIAVGSYVVWQHFYKKTPTPTNKHQDYKFDKNQIVADVSTRADALLSEGINDFKADVVRKGNGQVGDWQADFQAEKYVDVIRNLEAVGAKRDAEQSFYLAEAYLKMNPKNTQKAQPLLKTVAEGDNLFAKDALWSYALICLVNKENEAAKKALHKIIEISNAHGAEAEALLRGL